MFDDVSGIVRIDEGSGPHRRRAPQAIPRHVPQEPPRRAILCIGGARHPRQRRLPRLHPRRVAGALHITPQPLLNFRKLFPLRLYAFTSSLTLSATLVISVKRLWLPPSHTSRQVPVATPCKELKLGAERKGIIEEASPRWACRSQPPTPGATAPARGGTWRAHLRGVRPPGFHPPCHLVIWSFGHLGSFPPCHLVISPVCKLLYGHSHQMIPRGGW